jgi:retron-type reverse transcriptase
MLLIRHRSVTYIVKFGKRLFGYSEKKNLHIRNHLINENFVTINQLGSVHIQHDILIHLLSQQ